MKRYILGTAGFLVACMTTIVPAHASCSYGGVSYSVGAKHHGQECMQDGTWSDLDSSNGGSIMEAQKADIFDSSVRLPEARMCKTRQRINGKFRYCNTGGYNGPPPVGWTCKCRIGFGSDERTVPGLVVDINRDPNYPDG